MNRTEPATLPPSGLDGLDPSWSRLVTVPELDGVGRTFHVLDNRVADPQLTLLCVHGNPSWSYLWRDLLAADLSGVRVVAIDHLSMGFSEMPPGVRRLRRRVDDLSALTGRLGLDGAVVTVGHDWGGPISLGWVAAHRDQVVGVVLSNTAVRLPPGAAVPRLIGLARASFRLFTVATSVFVRGAWFVSGKRIPDRVREGFLAPYRSARRRRAVGDFVEDVPLRSSHPSHATLTEIEKSLASLGDLPVLLLWGARDPVFSDRFLHDLESLIPHAQVHRHADAGHYLPAVVDLAAAIRTWLEAVNPGLPATLRVSANPGLPATLSESDSPQLERGRRLWTAIEDRSDDPATAVAEVTGRAVSFADLWHGVVTAAAGLVELGVREGDRVAPLIPPGVDLTMVVYACWRIGAVVVAADPGLGVGGVGHCLKSAAPDFIVGVDRGLRVARILRWPGRRLRVAQVMAGSGTSLPIPPGQDLPAAIVFTSGATGPSKGVRYTHRQIESQVETVRDTYRITTEDSLVAAFPPFAIYGPALGIPSAVPDMDPTAPRTLTAPALAEAVSLIDATLVFAAPAALRNVAATGSALTSAHREALGRVRTVMSAGAPVPADIVRDVLRLMPSAQAHTPYGMTEVLPVTDITLTEVEDAGSGDGVCVGRPVAGVELAIDPLVPGSTTGEILIRAPHAREGYDRLAIGTMLASRPPGWHRSGDVGHVDDQGRLWVEGRLVHVIWGPGGPITPVGIEVATEALDEVEMAAAVGVGPVGIQQVVVIVTLRSGVGKPQPASVELTDKVRSAVSEVVTAVLVVPSLPVDIRHNSKIDRVALSGWAEGILAGGPVRRP